MPRQDPLPCEVSEIIAPAWDKITSEQRQAILSAFKQLDGLFGEASSRRGFSSLNYSEDDNTIIGFYVQEDLRRGLEGSTAGELLLSTRANFEKLFFAFILDVGHIILQRTRISSDYVALNYPTMKRDFENTLQEIMILAGLNVSQLQLQRFYRLRSQEEMYTIFTENVVDEIEVVDLKDKVVREDIQLSNPDPSEEIMLKRIFNGDFQRIEAETIKAANGEDLRKTKSAKAAIGAGTTRKIVTRNSSGETDTYYTEQDEKINVPIDDQKSELDDRDMQNVIEIYERRIRRIPLSRVSHESSDLGPLFTWKQGLEE